jgi:hypothetical protein
MMHLILYIIAHNYSIVLTGPGSGTTSLLESISKIGFWFKIPSSPNGFAGTRAAGPSFPALLDSPSDLIRLVGHKPQAYCCMLRI